jgi:hypothetical protein
MDVLKKPSLMTRIVVGKTVGFAFGLLAFLLLPSLMPDVGWLLRFGVLFWYTTLGAIIAVFGVFNWHPIFKIPMPWWLFAPIVGAWMNFLLALIAFDTLESVMLAVFGADGLLRSPFWISVEGAVIGFVIGYFATRFGGEGPATAGH